MKPQVGTTVYCLWNNCILRHTVGYVGKQSFIIEAFRNDVEFSSLEWDYDEYDITWYKTLPKAKKALISQNGGHGIVMERGEGYWEYLDERIFNGPNKYKNNRK